MRLKVQKTKDAAIDQVRDNNLSDYTSILAFAELWAPKQMKLFTSEDLKNAFYAAGNPEPEEPRVFGAVFRKLKKDKIIFHNGYRTSENEVCHGRPQSLWMSINYRLKQQTNARPNHGMFNLFNI